VGVDGFEPPILSDPKTENYLLDYQWFNFLDLLAQGRFLCGF